MGKVKTKEDLNEDEVKRAKYLRNVLREQIYPLMCEIDGIEFVKVSPHLSWVYYAKLD